MSSSMSWDSKKPQKVDMLWPGKKSWLSTVVKSHKMCKILWNLPISEFVIFITVVFLIQDWQVKMHSLSRKILQKWYLRLAPAAAKVPSLLAEPFKKYLGLDYSRCNLCIIFKHHFWHFVRKFERLREVMISTPHQMDLNPQKVRPPKE